MSTRLTTIVPVYDVESYVARCLRSVMDQGLPPEQHQIVVVDDGSRDRSPEILRSVLGDRPNVIIERQRNAGLSAARNRGMELAEGTFVHFVDSDDHLAHGALATLVDTMEQLELDVLTFGHRNVPNSLPASPVEGLIGMARPTAVDGTAYIADHHYANNAWWYVLRAEHLEQHKLLFEEGRFVEDALFTARALSTARRLAEVPVEVYRYVQRDGSIMRNHDVAHTAKLLRDYERVVIGLEELKSQHMATGRATVAWLRRIRLRQDSFVFFLLGRYVRSDLPLDVELGAILDRLERAGAYPTVEFPGRDYPGFDYRALSFIFNHRPLIRPFGVAFRGIRGMRSHRLAPSLPGVAHLQGAAGGSSDP